MSVLTLQSHQLKDRDIIARFGLDEQDGRCSVYTEPVPEHLYVIGADFAYGIEGRDYDAAVILDVAVKPIRQVAELHGRWGERFDRLLYAAACYYNGAFILGERQVGLPTLRRLYDEYEYRFLFYERGEAQRARRVTDKLGYHLSSADVTLPALRRAVRDHEVELMSEPLITQMSMTVYWSPTEITKGEKEADEKLRVKLQGGGSPDLVRAACYAWHATGEVHHYPKPQPRFRKGSMGDILGHKAMFEKPKGHRR